MTIQEQIKADTIAARKLQNPTTMTLLQVVTGELDRIGKEVSDVQTIAVVRKMITNAQTLGNQQEVEILSKYVPQSYEQYEVEMIVIKIIEDNKFNSPSQLGLVMKMLKERPDISRIDNKMASDATRHILSLPGTSN